MGTILVARRYTHIHNIIFLVQRLEYWSKIKLPLSKIIKGMRKFFKEIHCQVSGHHTVLFISLIDTSVYLLSYQKMYVNKLPIIMSSSINIFFFFLCITLKQLKCIMSYVHKLAPKTM